MPAGPRVPVVPPPCGGNVGPVAQPKIAGAARMPNVPAPCGGNVGARSVQPKVVGAAHVPTVPAPCGGNVGTRTVQPKAAGGADAHRGPPVLAPCGGRTGPMDQSVQAKALIVSRSAPLARSGGRETANLAPALVIQRLVTVQEAQAFLVGRDPDLFKTQKILRDNLYLNTVDFSGSMPNFNYFDDTDEGVVVGEAQALILQAQIALARRKEIFKAHDPGTWDLNPINYLNKTGTGDFSQNRGIETQLEKGELLGNGAKGKRLQGAEVNAAYHSHINGGSGGIAFCYLLEDDYTVTPCVIDIAGSRGGKNDNQYKWSTGGTDYLPASKYFPKGVN
jgi:hypothetical protein